MNENVQLALIVGAARSGTTLTRLLLDAHPEIGAPAEAGIPALMSHMTQVWSTVHADELASRGRDDPGTPAKEQEAAPKWDEPREPTEGDSLDEPRIDIPPEGREWILSTVDVPMKAYCARAGKRVYCDKSLDSVHHLPLVHELLPDAKVVLVFRHVMDTVASGIEASPWGFNAYGYGPYIQVSPGNSVAALASYWLEHVDRALRWEKKHPDQCHRVTYEELVLRPQETVAGIMRFLGVAPDLSVLAHAFDRKPARGPGDYKVEYTSGVHAASVGRGKRVPVAMLPPRLLEAVNEKLAALGYEPLDRGWNAAERAVDQGGQGFWARRLEELMSSVHIKAGTFDVGSFAVVAEDHRALRWVVEPDAPSIVQGDGDVNAVLTGTAEDLVLMLTGEENVGGLLRSGRLRHVTPEEDGRQPRDVLSDLSAVVAVLHAGLAPNGRPALTAIQGAG